MWETDNYMTLKSSSQIRRVFSFFKTTETVAKRKIYLLWKSGMWYAPQDIMFLLLPRL